MNDKYGKYMKDFFKSSNFMLEYLQYLIPFELKINENSFKKKKDN